MFGRTHNFILFLIFSVALLLACRLTDSLNLTASDTSSIAPDSTFVPHRKSLVVDLEEQTVIETYHTSKNRFGSLEISVNVIPVAQNGSRINETLASVDLATIKVLAPTTEYADGKCIGNLCDELATSVVSITSEPILVLPIRSEYPNTTWNVFLIWTGHVPGTYDLTLLVTDNAGNQGQRITQRIEVKDFSP